MLLDILNCAAHGFADISMSQQDRKHHRMECKILVSYYVSGYRGAVQQCYKWQNSVRSWTMELKEELYNIGLAFVWTKQQECNWKEI